MGLKPAVGWELWEWMELQEHLSLGLCGNVVSAEANQHHTPG